MSQGQHHSASASVTTSGKAVASLILGILSVVLFLNFLTGIPALILGFRALKNIKASQGRIVGKRMAVTGISSAALGMLLCVVAGITAWVEWNEYKREIANIKGTHDMAARLWAVSHALRSDLAASHFEGGNKLSDSDFASAQNKPREGFFRIQQFVDLGTPEGSLDGINSYRVGVKTEGKTPGHVLHFTVRLKGNNIENFFDTPVPNDSPLFGVGIVNAPYGRSLYKSQWAEVAYLLSPTTVGGAQTTAEPGFPPQKRYTLLRVVRVLVSNNLDVNAAKLPSPNKAYDGMSCKPGVNPLNFNMPNEVTVPNNRSINLATDLPPPVGADPSLSDLNPPCSWDNMICSEVLSFQVRFLPAPDRRKPVVFGYPIGVQDFIDPPAGYHDSSDMPAGKWKDNVFLPDDPTASGNPILALEIVIRIWDVKTQQTRQVTIVQDM